MKSFLNALQIPRDVSDHEPILTCYGSHVFVIENYQKILEYHSTCIRILYKQGIIQIQGTSLMITYYCRDEMKITGFILAVFFEHK